MCISAAKCKRCGVRRSIALLSNMASKNLDVYKERKVGEKSDDKKGSKIMEGTDGMG